MHQNEVEDMRCKTLLTTLAILYAPNDSYIGNSCFNANNAMLFYINIYFRRKAIRLSRLQDRLHSIEPLEGSSTRAYGRETVKLFRMQQCGCADELSSCPFSEGRLVYAANEWILAGMQDWSCLASRFLRCVSSRAVWLAETKNPHVSGQMNSFSHMHLQVTRHSEGLLAEATIEWPFVRMRPFFSKRNFEYFFLRWRCAVRLEGYASRKLNFIACSYIYCTISECIYCTLCCIYMPIDTNAVRFGTSICAGLVV